MQVEVSGFPLRQRSRIDVLGCILALATVVRPLKELLLLLEMEELAHSIRLLSRLLMHIIFRLLLSLLRCVGDPVFVFSLGFEVLAVRVNLHF